MQFENILVGFKKLSLKHFRIIQFLSRPQIWVHSANEGEILEENLFTELLFIL